MNKPLQIFLGTLSLTALLGAGCLGTTEQSSEVTTETSTEISTPTEESSSNLFTGSLSGALALSQKMTCTWSAEEGVGTAYIDGEKFAMITTIDGRKSSMIGTDDCIFTWEMGGTEGIKMCNLDELATELNGSVTAGAETEATSPNAQALAEELQVDAEVNCVAGIENESVFTPPANVTFIDPFAALNFNL